MLTQVFTKFQTTKFDFSFLFRYENFHSKGVYLKETFFFFYRGELLDSLLIAFSLSN